MSAPEQITPARIGLARVEPSLREMMALAEAARALPAFTRIRRARHAGLQLSRLRGRGMEYDESRPYQPGDDIRQLDWRVTARTGKPHTKLFREERERPVFTCVDCRAGMYFATRKVFKIVQGARIAALLGWRAHQSGDRLGGLVFGNEDHHEIAPARGQVAVARWLRALCGNAAAWRGRRAPRTDAPGNRLLEAVVRLRRLAKPGSLVFLISDFRGLDESVHNEIARLGAHCDVVLICVYDEFEARFPDVDISGALSDGATVLKLTDLSTRNRARYETRFTNHIDALRQGCRERRMMFTAIGTDEDPLPAMIRMFQT